MGKKLLCALLCALLILVILVCSLPLTAAEGKSDKQAVLDGILAYELRAAGATSLQGYCDGSLALSAGESAEWFVLALKRYDSSLSFSRYADALEAYVEKNGSANLVTAQKYALALIASGRVDAKHVTKTRARSLASEGIMSHIFALHLLNNGISLWQETTDSVAKKILSLRLADGGWALSGEHSDADITAMALQALAPHRTKEGVTAAIDAALTRLSQMQKAQGDFASYGVSNPESTSQVMMALCALGIDPLQDARFIKNGNTLFDGMMRYRLADGSFCHALGGKTNTNATVQALCALIALSLFEKGEVAFYEYGEVGELPVLTAPDTQAPTPDTSSDKDADAKQSVPLWKWCVFGGIVLLALVLAAWRFHKSRAFSDILIILGAAALLSVLLFTIHLQSPDEYYRYEEPKEPIGEVTFSIDCSALAEKESFDKDGVMVEKGAYKIGEGDSVYDLLLRVTKAHRMPLVTSGVESVYISGIDGLQEGQYGSLSGWVYTVNGDSPSLSCDKYILQDGDEVVFSYTLTLGSVGEN